MTHEGAPAVFVIHEVAAMCAAIQRRIEGVKA